MPFAFDKALNVASAFEVDKIAKAAAEEASLSAVCSAFSLSSWQRRADSSCDRACENSEQ